MVFPSGGFSTTVAFEASLAGGVLTNLSDYETVRPGASEGLLLCFFLGVLLGLGCLILLSFCLFEGLLFCGISGGNLGWNRLLGRAEN